eukprot:Nitzschia sp. Nitz4//scaffold109_size72162//31603//31935//NITZ4_005845-RA/size72162-processed-gene-0.11-mRNA-1//1//CDS//3329532760//8461//frame0
MSNNHCYEHYVRTTLRSPPVSPFTFLFPPASHVGADTADIFPPLPSCFRGRQSSNDDLSVQDVLDIVDAALHVVGEGPLVGQEHQSLTVPSDTRHLQSDALSDEDDHEED